MGSLFSKENRKVFSGPLNLNNPILIQVLGICSALAVTAQLEPAIVMGLSVTVITAFSNVIISLIRKTIPNRIRIIIQLVVVAALVTIVSMILKAFVYDVSVQLSVYVVLAWILVVVGGVRELFGRGTLFGFSIIPQSFYDAGYVDNGMMTMPTMAMIILGCVIWAHRSIVKEEDLNN